MGFERNDLNETKLPTNRDVIQYLMFLKHEGTASVAANHKLTDYVGIAASKIFDLWHRSNIPTVSILSIRRNITGLVNKYFEFTKHARSLTGEKWPDLFRISQCKCRIELEECKCLEAAKIPLNTRLFFIDQCGPRLMLIANSPVQTVVRDVEMTDYSESSSSVPQFMSDYIPTISEQNEFDENCEAEELSTSIETHLKVSDIELRNFVSALDRSDTGSRFGSLHATMLLQDLRAAFAKRARKDSNPVFAMTLLSYLEDIIIDKNKIQRERQKWRAAARSAAKIQGLLKCISFDGKKESTLKEIRKPPVLEEHVTIIKEPGSEFISYVTPTGGTGQEIQQAIVDFLESENYNMDYLTAISSDGTVVNTGYKNGVIPFMERYLQRPLQWFVCLFHFNELPLKSLFEKLLGKQTGPGYWPGQLGRDLSRCHTLPVSFDFN